MIISKTLFESDGESHHVHADAIERVETRKAVGSRDLAGEEPASAETRQALADTKRQLPVVGMEVIL